MKHLYAILLTVFLVSAHGLAAGEEILIITIPGTNTRDFTKPSIIREGNYLYQTIPGTSQRDFTKPGVEIKQESGRLYVPTINNDSLNH